VLPLDNRVLWTILNPKPDHRRPRHTFIYYPGGAPVPEAVCVDTRNRSHRVDADVTVPEGPPPEGVLLAVGSALGGWSLHLLDGRLTYVHNLYGKERYPVAATDVVPPGRHTLSFVFDRTAEHQGHGRLLVDGREVAEGPIPRFTPSAFNNHGAGLTCGYELGPAIGVGYEAPFPCTARVHSATVTVEDRVVVDPEARFTAIMSEQ